MSVVRSVETYFDPVGFEQWVELFDLRGADKVRFDIQIVKHAFDGVKPIHFVVGNGQTDGATAVPTGGLTGFSLQYIVIEVGPIGVDLCHVEVANKMRHQSSGVPGGPRG